ncbi:MAG: hypothetical protein ACK5N0_14335 [Synechococcaceae cyanobacterium]
MQLLATIDRIRCIGLGSDPADRSQRRHRGARQALAGIGRAGSGADRHRALGLSVGVAVSAAAWLGCPAGAQAALLRYSANGGGISGSLGGESFSNALWQVSATADSSNVLHLMIPAGPGQQIEAWLLKPVSPTLQLNWAGGQRSTQLQANSPFAWSILSGLFPTGPSPKLGFVYANPTFSEEHAAGLVSLPASPNPNLFNNLQQPTTLTSPFGIFETSTYPTDGGDLIITSANVVPGTFQIAPVPAPLPVLGGGIALSWSRRLRRRCRRHSQCALNAIAADAGDPTAPSQPG